MTKANHVARCRCGGVEIGGWSNPLVVAACYCDACQAASERLAASANGAPAAAPTAVRNLWCSAATASLAREARKTFSR